LRSAGVLKKALSCTSKESGFEYEFEEGSWEAGDIRSGRGRFRMPASAVKRD
jgi:hypothetical protein